MNTLLNKLFGAQVLSQSESQSLFNAIIRGELTESQLAAVLISMKIRGEQPAEIAGAALACLENAQPFPRPDYTFSDIVGTGGDVPTVLIFQQPVHLWRLNVVLKSLNTVIVAYPAVPALLIYWQLLVSR